MPLVEIARATPAHAAYVAANMRPADRDEVWASGRLTPDDAVMRSIAVTALPLAGLVDGVPACVFGIARRSLLSDEGAPWLLGTDAIARHGRRFLRENRRVLPVLAAPFALLVNYVDVRNAVSIRWLRWLGFEIEPAAPFGIHGLTFHRFSMRIDHV